MSSIFDGFVKSPSAALRGDFVGEARLASGAFYKALFRVTFCKVIIFAESGLGFVPERNPPPLLRLRKLGG